jgi:hypothetical protein
MQRFKMTSDGFHTWTPLIVMPLVVGPLLATGALAKAIPHPALWVGVGASALVVLILVGTTMLTPTAVLLTAEALEVERLAWPSFRVPLAELVSVEEGPRSAILTGEVGRVAGVGGWFWSGGLFRARGIGNVRAWLRRLGPTVVVRRKEGLPLLFGLDDPEGLRAALQRRL